MPIESPYSWIEIERIGKVTVVRLTSRAILEERTIKLIGEELTRLVEKFGNRELLLDFSQVKNLGSYMLASLVTLQKKILQAGGRLVLCAIDPELYKVFELTRLTKVFNIYPDEDSALLTF